MSTRIFFFFFLSLKKSRSILFGFKFVLSNRCRQIAVNSSSTKKIWMSKLNLILTFDYLFYFSFYQAHQNYMRHFSLTAPAASVLGLLLLTHKPVCVESPVWLSYRNRGSHSGSESEESDKEETRSVLLHRPV